MFDNSTFWTNSLENLKIGYDNARNTVTNTEDSIRQFIDSLLPFAYITLFVFVLVKFSSCLRKRMFSIFTLNNSTNMLFTNLNISYRLMHSTIHYNCHNLPRIENSV